MIKWVASAPEAGRPARVKLEPDAGSVQAITSLPMCSAWAM